MTQNPSTATATEDAAAQAEQPQPTLAAVVVSTISDGDSLSLAGINDATFVFSTGEEVPEGVTVSPSSNAIHVDSELPMVIEQVGVAVDTLQAGNVKLHFIPKPGGIFIQVAMSLEDFESVKFDVTRTTQVVGDARDLETPWRSMEVLIPMGGSMGMGGSPFDSLFGGSPFGSPFGGREEGLEGGLLAAISQFMSGRRSRRGRESEEVPENGAASPGESSGNEES